MNTRKDIDSIFEAGKKYTIFSIGGIGMTTKLEMQVTDFHEGNPVFKKKGKRKQFILKLRTQSYQTAPIKECEFAIFEGWDQPITCDTDGFSSFRGNALFNFVADPEAIRAWIEAGQLNPNFNRSIVISVEANNSDSKEVAVYPELYKPGHAVLDRILKK